MELLILLFFWGMGALIVGLIGSNYSLGFWATFLLSLLLSPILGLIFALVSGSRRKVVHPATNSSFDQARMAENRGELELAIKFYQDTIWQIKNKPPGGNIHVRNFRLKRLKESEDKIEQLTKLVSIKDKPKTN